MSKSSNIPFNPAKLPFFYGWIIIAAGTVGVIFSIPGQTMGVSVFTDYLIDSLQLSRDTLSTAYLIGTISSSFILTYGGKLYDRYGVRIVVLGSSLLLAASVTLASFSPEISKEVSSLLKVHYTIISFLIITTIFFLIRFSGQGVLTLASRNMIMKWFDKLRGRANAISSAIVSLGFAVAPLILNHFIQQYNWDGAWRLIGFMILLFAVFAFVFYRDNPEAIGLIPDGKDLNGKSKVKTVNRQFTLKEARRTWAFWIFTASLAFYSFFGTGFTFNIVSIAESFGYTQTQGLSIFIPISVVSVVISVTGNFLSDFIRLQYLLFSMLAGALLTTVSFSYFGTSFGYYGVIGGLGLMGGLFVVLISVTWPRFFGRKYLGAISGLSSSILVFSSAAGPLFFSKVLTITHNYQMAGIISAVIVLLLIAAGFKARNPQ